jgi:uncharacterized protein
MNGKISRRQFLRTAGLAGGTLVAGYAFGIEPNLPRVSRLDFRSDGAAPGCRLRLVQLSDLHLGHVGALERETARLVRELRPDLVVITGDVCNRPQDLESFDAFLSLLRDAAPVYGVTGNWEYRAGLDLTKLDGIYRRHRGRLLINESTALRHAGADLLLTGLDQKSPHYGKAVQGTVSSGNHLVLTHPPAVRDRLAAQLKGTPAPPPQLMLAGHTHGGQVTLFGYAPIRPTGSGRYTHGWYDGPGPRLYVSRGIGTTALPVRFMAPPEIVCIDWQLRPRDTGVNWSPSR